MALRTQKPPESPTGIYVARSAGVFKIKGKLYEYRRGQTFQADHPLLRVRPDAFAPLTFAQPAVSPPEVRG